MHKYVLSLLCMFLVSFCSAAEKQLKFNRFYNAIELQTTTFRSNDDEPGTAVFRKAHVVDHTCLFRVYLEGLYLINDLTCQRKNKDNRKHLADDSFLHMLPFDSYVNPQLYSAVCDAHSATPSSKYCDIADKLVYFNTDRRVPPVAGKYAKSYVKTETFRTIQKNTTRTINAYEPLFNSVSSYLNYYYRNFCYEFLDHHLIDETRLEPSLCFNADYKKLLHHIQAMQKVDKYTFGFVSTKDGGFAGMTIGHGMIIVADKNNNKNNNKIVLTCMDSCNLDSYWFAISAKRLEQMIQNPHFLKDAIVRYVCATKSAFVAQKEIEELGLNDHPLYVNYYKKYNFMSLLSMQNIRLLVLFLVSLYVSRDVMY